MGRLPKSIHSLIKTYKESVYKGVVSVCRSGGNSNKIVVAELMSKIIFFSTAEQPILFIGEILVDKYSVKASVCESPKNCVIEVECIETHRTYAMKIGDVQSNFIMRNKFKKEFLIMKKFSQNKYFPKVGDTMFNFRIDGGVRSGYVMEKYGGDLYEEIISNVKYNSKGVHVNVIREIAKCTVFSLEALHTEQIIHNDVKLENIFFRNETIRNIDLLSLKTFLNTGDIDTVLIYFGLSI